MPPPIAGIPCGRNTTLVTAFYPIKSKFPSEQYMKWAENFMRLQAPVVLFTTRELVPLFRNLRERVRGGPLHTIALPFEELDTWVLYEREWRKAHELDHEREYHTPELYAIWAQKAFFVERAILANVFDTEYFFWCDIGAFRSQQIVSNIVNT